MTIDQIGPDMVGLVPALAAFPRQNLRQACLFTLDGQRLHQQQGGGIDTVIITGGETDVCVLATMLGAVDWGVRVILVQDALCSSADETHDASFNKGPRRN